MQVSGKVNSTGYVTVGSLWQGITCSEARNQIGIPVRAPLDPWSLEVDYFTIQLLDNLGFNVPFAVTRSLPKLTAIPNFVTLSNASVNITISNDLSSLSPPRGATHPHVALLRCLLMACGS
jgi:hypothetical protein